MNPDQVVALLMVVANLQLAVSERDERIKQLEETLAALTHPEST